MKGINQVTLIGRVGQDPEIRFTQNNDAIANLSVATSEQWKDKQTGEKKEATEWHRCVAYRKLAEIIGEYVKKGSLVYLQGKLKTRKWQGQDGVERYTTEIIVNELQMLDSKQSGQAQPQARQPQPAAQHTQGTNVRQPNPQQQQPQQDTSDGDLDDELPHW